MNILFIIPSLGTGGAQTFLIRLALQLNRNGHNVFVYDMDPSKRDFTYYQSLKKEVPVIEPLFHKLEKWLIKKNIRTKILKKIYLKFSLKDRLNKWQIMHLYRKNEIEIVNTHMYLADVFATKIFQNTKGVKLVSSFHGCYTLIQKEIEEGKIENVYKEKFFHQAEQVIQLFSGFIYVTSHQLKFPNNLSLEGKKKQKIYYGFLPAEKSNNLGPVERKKADIVVGMVARGDKTKGWEELIISYKRVKERNIHLQMELWLVGGGEFLNGLKVKYQRPDILFFGNVGDPMPYTNQFDIAALPTFFPAESLPNSVIEYLYAGKPVIATEVAEIPLMLQDDSGRVSGKIIPLLDGKANVELLAEALEQYFKNPNLIKKHSSMAKNAFKKFEMDNCVHQYLSFFREILLK